MTRADRWGANREAPSFNTPLALLTANDDRPGQSLSRVMVVGTELADAPWPPSPITTQRLVLRSTCASDRAGYIDLLTSDEVHKYLGGPHNREETERHAPPIPGNRPGVFAVEAVGAFVGVVVLDRRDAQQPGHLRPEGGELEVSYTFLPAHWARGYATEAVTAVLDWAATSLPDHDVIVCTQLANERSLRLARRLGFREVTRFQQFDAAQWLGSRDL